MPRNSYLRGSGFYLINTLYYGPLEGFSGSVARYNVSTESQDGAVAAEIVVVGTSALHSANSLIYIAYATMEIQSEGTAYVFRLVLNPGQIRLIVSGEHVVGTPRGCNTVCDASGKVIHLSSAKEITEADGRVWAFWTIESENGARLRVFLSEQAREDVETKLSNFSLGSHVRVCARILRYGQTLDMDLLHIQPMPRRTIGKLPSVRGQSAKPKEGPEDSLEIVLKAEPN